MRSVERKRAMRSWRASAAEGHRLLQMTLQPLGLARDRTRTRARARARALTLTRLLQMTLAAAASLRHGSLGRALRSWAGATGQAILLLGA